MFELWRLLSQCGSFCLKNLIIIITASASPKAGFHTLRVIIELIDNVVFSYGLENEY